MIRFWPLLLSLLVATVLTLSSCASTPTEEVAQKCPTSMLMSQWVEDTTNLNPLIALKHVRLNEDQISVFMAAFNATPPESNYSPDAIVIFTSPGDPRGIVGFSQSGCLMMAHAYPLPVVSSWMAGRPVRVQNNKGKTL